MNCLIKRAILDVAHGNSIQALQSLQQCARSMKLDTPSHYKTLESAIYGNNVLLVKHIVGNYLFEETQKYKLLTTAVEYESTEIITYIAQTFQLMGLQMYTFNKLKFNAGRLWYRKNRELLACLIKNRLFYVTKPEQNLDLSYGDLQYDDSMIHAINKAIKNRNVNFETLIEHSPGKESAISWLFSHCG